MQFIVNDIRNFVFGLAKAHIYGFCRAGNRNLLCRLLYFYTISLVSTTLATVPARVANSAPVSV